MSMVVPNIGCHDASHWSYSASVVQKLLAVALQNEGIAGQVPKGVLSDVRKLFKITLKQNTGDSSVDHEVAQLHTLMVAWHWFEAVKRNATKNEIQTGMQGFLSLLELLSCSENTSLNQAEQKTARQLIVFLNKLIHEAEEKHYESVFQEVY